jgi:hypothetical protein
VWCGFARFGPAAVLGVAAEQSTLYERASGWRLSGKNGEVQLLHLARMRGSPAYTAQLDRFASGAAGVRLGYLGDQTLYTHMARDAPRARSATAPQRSVRAAAER